MQNFVFLFFYSYVLTNTFMSSCSVAKKQTEKPIRQVHTDRCHALMSPHFIEVDAFLQAPVLKKNVEEKRSKKIS